MISSATDLGDALTYARKVIELEELRGGSLAAARREIEKTWLEIAFVESITGGHNNVSVITGDVASLEGAVSRLSAELIEVEADASVRVSDARGRLQEAQQRLDTGRLELVREAGCRWREHAARLREQASECGDETVTVSEVVTGPGMPDYRVPHLVFRATQLEQEAAQADANAALCETWLTWIGSDSAALAERVSQLEFPPKSAAG